MKTETADILWIGGVFIAVHQGWRLWASLVWPFWVIYAAVKWAS